MNLLSGLSLPRDSEKKRFDIRDVREQEEHGSEKNADRKCRKGGSETSFSYWCETCQQQIPEKRCPGCGLKARKIRSLS